MADADRPTAARQALGPAAYTLELRIDELVLHGFRPGDRYAIAAAVERELGRLLSEQGAPPALAGGHAGERATADEARRLVRLDAGSFDLPHDATPDTIGLQIARAIHRGLGGASAAGRGPRAEGR